MLGPKTGVSRGEFKNEDEADFRAEPLDAIGRQSGALAGPGA